MPAATPTPFSSRLRHWRRLRGFSQLELATRAEVSPRHISFMETGRSRPSSTMVLKLAETLDVPLRERNDLLRAAGFGPSFPSRDLSEPDLAPLRAIVDRMLRQHEPYPAFVIDRWWDVVAVNEPAERLFPEVTSGAQANAIETYLGPGIMRQVVENWAEVAWVTVHRLRHEAALAAEDERLQALLRRAEELIADVPPPAETDFDAPVVATKLRLGDQRVATISTITSFSGARDVTIDELRIELVFPADDAADAFFRAMAAS